MLMPPSKGFANSVNKHNGKVGALAEWIEGCITFVDDRISKVDIADTLVEGHLYQSQDFAKEWIADAWPELSRRKRCLGVACPFNLNERRIEKARSWTKTPAYSFCLMLSLQVSYRKSFLEMFGSDFTEQGRLLEQLTAESLEAIGWSTHGTGWSKVTANSIRDKVESLANHLGEPSRSDAIAMWTDTHAKDGGLDVVCHLPFADQWSGRPLLFVQCASGEYWLEKRATPILAMWEKLLDWSTRPTRGIAIPFALIEADFRRAANYESLSLILDRHRLSAPKNNLPSNWLSKPLAKELNEWTRSRLPALLESKAN
ncbi:MAG: hypothetical protein AABP62_22060 [Planctomycetota bacterium]